MKQKIIFLVLVFVFILSVNVYADDENWKDVSITAEPTNRIGTEYSLYISNVPVNPNYRYFLLTSDSENNVPAVTWDFELYYDANIDGFELGGFESTLESNQEDIYIWILKIFVNYETGEITDYSYPIEGKRIDLEEMRMQMTNYSKLILSNDESTILMNTPWSNLSTKLVQINVSEINDNIVLGKINENNLSLQELLNYAKGIKKPKISVSESIQADGYSTMDGNNLIDLNTIPLKNNYYYFVYTKIDDEDYYNAEAIVLAQAKVNENGGWYLTVYGNDDFDISYARTIIDSENDSLTSPGKGWLYILGSVLIVVGVHVFLHFYKKNAPQV